ncbi:PTS glucose transporter subunit IIA [Paenibacillus albidus]|uniref:PTS glucose transporter subunit IIA n=1 Tax=Paenibacillus albidus TaxID=2041023 RepID=A0A917C314_9BACL|nr:PTS glucose transporter subunit IIA [Paenibacillus albidus]GGF68372.1 PTS glucose transporter subunit IIA [Paenibacillus albidus]
MFSKWKSKKEDKQTGTTLEIIAPVSGKAVPLKEVPDAAFSGGQMGRGIAIQPDEGKLIAPFDGTVAHIVKSNHALILEHSSGAQLLLHIGIDTVSLKGSGFVSHVASGDVVKAGQTLIEFDLKGIQEAGCATISPIIVTGLGEQQRIVDELYGQVIAGKDRIITITSL